MRMKTAQKQLTTAHASSQRAGRTQRESLIKASMVGWDAESSFFLLLPPTRPSGPRSFGVDIYVSMSFSPTPPPQWQEGEQGKNTSAPPLFKRTVAEEY